MRAHNFGAGPCTLPLEALEEARAEFTDFAGTGMSLVELSHRSAEYDAVHHRTLDLTRSVSRAPDDFAIVFIQGGATLQFAMAPMNLLGPGERAGYVVSGSWGKAALADGSVVAEAYPAWDGKADGYRRMPRPGEVSIQDGTRFLHVTSNETIGGIRMPAPPAVGVPLVADMSSDYLSRPVEWDRYDLVYGGVQKNLGPAGMAVVFVRTAALDAVSPVLAKYLDYRWHVESNSLGNTPPMFTIYLMGKVLAGMESMGGIEAVERAAEEKATRLYAAIDGSDGFFSSPVEPSDRSHMNVVFTLPSLELEQAFLAGAEGRHMVGLKGHRSVGGCRASLYAALPMDSVDALCGYMVEFRQGR
jgi:phosphoserine aminotransferase